MAYQLSEKELKGITDVIRENVKKTESTPKQPSAAYTAFQNYIANGPEKTEAIQTRGATNVQKLDMQKNKEDRLEVKSTVNAAQIKLDRAKKQYDDYVKSDEYKQRVTANDQKAKAEAAAQMFLNPGQTMTTSEVIQDEKELQLRAAVEQAEAEYNASEDQKVIEQDLEAIAGISNEERRQLEQYAVGRDVDYYESLNFAQNGDLLWTQPQGRAEKNAEGLIEKYGKQRVDEMANTLSRINNEEMSEKVAEKGREQASSGFGIGAAASAATVPAGILSGIAGVFDYAKEIGRNDTRFKTLDANVMGNLGNVYSGAVRGQVAQNISGDVYDEETGQKIKDGGFFRELGSVGYQGLMSAADSIARAYLGGGAFGGAALAATGSFSQTMADASRQGATPAQAALLATVNSAIEAASEKIPLDELVDTAKGSKQTLKQMLVTALKQAGIEATTEEISLVGTVLAEAAILQDKSEYKKSYFTKILTGASPEQAAQETTKELVNEAVNTALVSMVSGGASSLGGSVAANQQWFAEEQQRNNPAVNQPKKGDVVKSVEDLQRKYGHPEAQQVQAFDAEQDRATAPESVQNALKNVKVNDDPMADRSAEFRLVDIDAIKKDPEAMQWLAKRGLVGNMEVALGRLRNGEYRVSNANIKTRQTEQKKPKTMQYGQRVKAGDRGNIGTVLSYDPGTDSYLINFKSKSGATKNVRLSSSELSPVGKIIQSKAQTTHPTEQAPQATQQPQAAPKSKQSTVIDSVVETIQRNGGNVTNRMAETVLNDTAAKQQLFEQIGMEISGSKSQQRQAVKNALPQMAAGQDTQTETAQNTPAAEPMQATETSEQATIQASAPTMDTQMGASNQSTEGAQQTEIPEMQRDRINAVREQEVPLTDPQGGKVSEFAGNAYQSSLTPDSFTDSIKRLVDEGQVSHDVQTNEESLRKGAEMIAKAGTERKAVEEIHDFANSGKFSPEYIAMGTLLYQDLTSQLDEQAKSGDVDINLRQDAENVFVSLQQMATNSGRALQLYNLFRKMSPESQVHVMEKEVQRNVEKMQKAGTVKRDYQPSIDPELSDMYRNAADEYQKASGAEAKQAAEQKMLDIQSVIYAEEAAKLPTTFKAKWDAWRYMAMLGNVKTQLRNLAGNTMMLPYTDAKRVVGAILEKGISKDQRTKAVFVDRQLMNWAKQDTANVRSVLEGSAKLGDSTTQNPLAEDVKTFGDSWIGERFNDMQGLINKAVSGGDMLFKNGEYARSLARFLKARGYTAADVQNNLVNQDVLNEARNFAVNEALKATFNDTNVLSDAFANGLRYKGENPAMKAINLLGEGIMPFRKTPANVVMRFKDYSPAGLVQGVWNMAANVRNGKVSAATAIDQISAGLTGTALMQLGYVLAGGIAGVKITGSGSDEDEKRQGHQNYALEFSVNGQEYSYTIDWASPANLPLFLGANIRAMQEAPDTASFLTATTNAARGSLEPLLQLSCLSSLNDMVESARYADEGEAIYTFLVRGATNYLTQGIPSLARQATQALTDNKQTTFVTSDDPVTGDVQKAVAGLGVGNPYKTDKRNAWGETEQNGEALSSLGMDEKVARAVDAFFNPGTLKKIDNSAVEQEITRLNKSQENNVSPDYAPKVITYTDKDGNLHKDQRLTEEQYQTYAQTQGQTARQLVEELIKSRSYEAMNDEQKAEAINLAYTYARETAEKAAFPDSLGYSEKWLMETDAAKNKAGYILNKVGTAMLSGAMGKIDTAWDNNYSAENVKSLSDQLAEDFAAYSKMPRSEKSVIYESLTGTTKKYVEAREKGVSHDDFMKTAKAINDVKGTGKYDKDTGNNAVRDIDKREAIASVPNLNQGARDILMKAYMTDYDSTDESPTKTEPKYDFIRQEMGLSAQDYVDSYRVYLDVVGKSSEIQGIMDAIGCDRATANKLRNLYGGWYKGSDWKNYLASY